MAVQTRSSIVVLSTTFSPGNTSQMGNYHFVAGILSKLMLAAVCGLLTSIVLAQPVLEMQYQVDIKPGKAPAFEKALRQYHDWLGRQGDAWRWDVWEILSGSDTSQYLLRSGGHDWQAFEDRSALDQRAALMWQQQVAGFTRAKSAYIRVHRADLGRATPYTHPPALISSNIFLVDYQRFSEFAAILPKLAQAMTETEYMYFNWYQVINGGRQYILMMEFPKQNWLDNNPPQQPYWSMVEDIYGSEETERMREIWFGSITSHVTRTERLRPELGYQPPAKQE